MIRRRHDLEVPTSAPPRQHMRVLRDEIELAEAAARAAEGERRLQDRLETRAAHEAKVAVQDVERPALRWPAGLRTAVLPPPRRTPLPEEAGPNEVTELVGPPDEPAPHPMAGDVLGKAAPPAA